MNDEKGRPMTYWGGAPSPSATPISPSESPLVWIVFVHADAEGYDYRIFTDEQQAADVAGEDERNGEPVPLYRASAFTTPSAEVGGSDDRVTDEQLAAMRARFPQDHVATESVLDVLDAGSTTPSATASLTPLERYALAVLEAHREDIGDLDGGFLQDKAEECGLLYYVEVTDPCGDYCRCAEYDDFPQQCLRLKPEFQPKMAALRVSEAASTVVKDG